MTKMIKVRFLRKHSKFAYNEGNIGTVTPEHFKLLTEGEDPYVERLPDDYIDPATAPQKIYKESEMIKARMITPYEGFALGIGKVGLFIPEHALKLLELGCIEVLPDDYQEPEEEMVTIPESEMIEGTVIIAHPGFVYKKDERGRFTPKDFEMLSKGGYVEGTKKESALKTKMMNKLRNILKK
jgi:hypothetical protein